MASKMDGVIDGKEIDRAAIFKEDGKLLYIDH